MAAAMAVENCMMKNEIENYLSRKSTKEKTLGKKWKEDRKSVVVFVLC